MELGQIVYVVIECFGGRGTGYGFDVEECHIARLPAKWMNRKEYLALGHNKPQISHYVTKQALYLSQQEAIEAAESRADKYDQTWSTISGKCVRYWKEEKIGRTNKDI